MKEAPKVPGASGIVQDVGVSDPGLIRVSDLVITVGLSRIGYLRYVLDAGFMPESVRQADGTGT